MISEREAHYRQIEQAMVQVQRSKWRGILPIEVLAFLDIDLTERQMTADMDALVKAGRLVKVGRGEARGYRLATGSQRAAHAYKVGRVPRGDVVTSEYTELVYQAIEIAVGKAYRDLKRGVLPRDIQARLPYDRAEGSLRRDCWAMSQAGRLVRISGAGARQGYRLPFPVERIAFSMNRGMWPHGTEQVVTWV